MEKDRTQFTLEERFERDRENAERQTRENNERMATLLTGIVDSLMSRQKKSENKLIRYTLLAHTLMLVFDAASSAAQTFSADFDETLKSKIQRSIACVQTELEDMLTWMQSQNISRTDN